MTEFERNELIATLVLVTGWNISVFKNLTDEEILKEYDRRVVGL